MLCCFTRKFLRKSTSDGFTLVELMIVLAIIGILTAIAAPQFQRTRERQKLDVANQLAEVTQAKVEVTAATPSLDYTTTKNLNSLVADLLDEIQVTDPVEQAREFLRKYPIGFNPSSSELYLGHGLLFRIPSDRDVFMKILHNLEEAGTSSKRLQEVLADLRVFLQSADVQMLSPKKIAQIVAFNPETGALTVKLTSSPSAYFAAIDQYALSKPMLVQYYEFQPVPVSQEDIRKYVAAVKDISGFRPYITP